MLLRETPTLHLCLTEIKLSRITLPKPVTTFITHLYIQNQKCHSKTAARDCIKTLVVPEKPPDSQTTVDGNTGNQTNAHPKTAATAKFMMIHNVKHGEGA